MPITVPQVKNNGFTAAAASVTTTFTSGIAAGSIVVCYCSFDSGATGVTLSDTAGDSVTDSGLGIITDSGSATKSCFKAFFSATTGQTAFKATFTGTCNFADLGIWEVAGLTSAQFDKVVHASGTATTADSGSSGTLTNANEACFGAYTTSSSAASAGSGWTDDGAFAGTSTGYEHQIVSATTALDAIFNGASGSWICWFASVMSGGGDVLQSQAVM